MSRRGRFFGQALSFCAVLAFGLTFGERVYGQVDTGTILGTVKDQSGAVIPHGKVTLTNEGTSFSISTVTAEDGSFVFTPIKIGNYTVTAEFIGFQKAVRAHIGVNIQQQVVVDFTLQPGQVTQTVEVTAAPPLLQTQNASVGHVVGTRQINDLPLNGRNYTFLAHLTTGVTTGQESGRGLEATGTFSANGVRPAQNNYLLDGIDNNMNDVDFLSGTSYVVRPPVDAIQEFKVQTSNFSAEIGRAGGAILNATIKSGTNEFHGDAWEFIRNDKLDAADFFENGANVKKGEFRRNQFGFAVGGPIIIPHVYNGRNKSFFFFDYEGTRIRQGAPLVSTVPTAAERNSGFTDFSDLITGQTGTRGPDLLGRTVPLGTIFDPATTRPVTAGAADPVTGLKATGTGFVRDSFPGNVIPLGRLGPNAVKLLSLYPLPTARQIINNFSINPAIRDNVNSFDVRVDRNFSERDQFFTRFSYFDEPKFVPGPFQGVADGGGFNAGNLTFTTRNVAVSWTHSFSPSLINEVRAGFSGAHTLHPQAFAYDTSDIPAKFGIQGIPQGAGNGGLPELAIGGLSFLGAGPFQIADRFSNTIQFTENLTKVYGRHTFKGGFEVTHTIFPWASPAWSRGGFHFDGNYTSIPNQADGSTGRAQFLLTPTGATVSNGVNNVGGADTVFASNFAGVDNSRNYYGAYFQDDWKINPKLILNLGLRWEFFGLVEENFGAQANFDPGPPFNGARYVFPKSRAEKGGLPLSQSFIDTLKKDGIAIELSDLFGLGHSQRTNFGPRVGFAYQFTPKLVLRGAYGVFYGGFENRGGANIGGTYPFLFNLGFFTPDDAHPVTYPDGAIGTLENGFLHIAVDPRSVNGQGLSLQGIQFNYITPYTQAYNFTLQHQVTVNNSIEIGYVGSLARHLETFPGANKVSKILPPGTNPQPFVPFPDLGRDMIFYAATEGNSYYHSLQAKFQRRFSAGLDLLAAYTYSKAQSDAADILSGSSLGTFGYRAPYVPGFGIQGDYGLADFDVRNIFHFSGTYELPVGQGRHFVKDSRGLVNAILGGWSTNWILTLQDGQPVTIPCTVAAAADVGCFALLVPGQSPIGGRHDVNQYWNPDAFTNPAPATSVGQTDLSPLGGRRSQVVGPGFHRFDWSMFKQFKTTETTHVEFRAEFFNLTNTPNFSGIFGVNLNFADKKNFGRLSTTRDTPNDPRQIQFALKFYW